MRFAATTVLSWGLLGSIAAGGALADGRPGLLSWQDHPASLLAGPTGRARAIILYIGDGMGQAQRTSATWSAIGLVGTLEMDAMPAAGWSHTYSADNAVTDSAAGGTAIATGIKTNNGYVSVDTEGNPLTTILERAQSRGMAVGLVTTTQMAHATPAVFAAHVPDRTMMVEIARQMVEKGVDVLLGGGEDEFLPTSDAGCYPEPGERNDGRDLIAEAVAVGYAYVCDSAGLQAIEVGTTSRLLGLFADEAMIRPFSPTLATMTQSAIDVLSKDPDGFFLMVEGGQIDWAGHANDAANAIQDTLGLDEAVAVGQLYAQTHLDTLIIVTADHETGGMAPALQSSGMPGEDGPFFMSDGTPFFVNWSTTAHTGVDVPISAQGLWAQSLDGTHENTRIHAVMHAALVGASFTDVLPDHWSWPYVEALAAAGLTAGCGGGRFCADDEVGRDQVAVFLERAIRGAGFNPPPASGVFSDVPDDYWAAGWIEQLAADGITAGCGGGAYCPAMAVTRSQMAILLERAQFWPGAYMPPPATGLVFDDVPPAHWAGAWIEQLAADGISAGCSAAPALYCPDSPVTRSQMAVFLVRTFSLPLP